MLPIRARVESGLLDAGEALVRGSADRLSPAQALLQTKLARPRAPSDEIARPRLLESLSAGLGSAVTLLCAPAGFGKTTLLAQWLTTLSRPVAWLSLDEGDNELPFFVHGLVSALRDVAPDACRASASLFGAPQYPPLSEVVVLLLNDLADMSEDLIVVLDDYHLIHQREIHSLLVQVSEHLPQQLHLVLSTRIEPPLPLTRWRARGQLHDLSAADVRFTPEETHAFLAGALGPEVAQQTAGTLAERTQGWAALLRLAALSLRGTADRVAFLERLARAADWNMSRYLTDEVLERLAPDAQEVLERTSILDQFCAELGAATLGGGSTARQVQVLLDECERANLFVAPLDERQGWYRFHPLFRTVLEQRLQARVGPEELAALHRRASAWYTGHGLLDESLRHALAARDTSAAVQLLEAHALRTYEQQRWVQMERWLRLLPQGQTRNSPGLLVSRAWVAQVRGRLHEMPPLLEEASRLLAISDRERRDPDDRQSRFLHSLLAIWWSYFHYHTGQVRASLEAAKAAVAWVPPGEERFASLAMRYLALCRHATGQGDLAIAELQQALQAQSARPDITARLLHSLALVYLAAGKLHHLELTARHLLELAQEGDLAISQFWAHYFLGAVHYERNDLEAAAYHFSAVVANRHRAHFWAVQEAMCGLAFLYQAQGLDSTAQETLDALIEMVQGQHNLPQLLVVYACCGELALLRGEVVEAEQWIELAGEQEEPGPMLYQEDPPLTRARLLLAQGDAPSVARGQALLADLLRHVEAIDNGGKTIKVLALQAWAFHLQGCADEARGALERAIELGRPAGYIRTFADLPGLAPVIMELRARRRAQRVIDKKLDVCLQRILAAMHPMAAQAVSTDELMKREGLEPLTPRELHILRLLDMELTNQEIARELVVTPGTVKVHISNLYRKLAANNRRSAVSLARALGLLTSTPAERA